MTSFNATLRRLGFERPLSEREVVASQRRTSAFTENTAAAMAARLPRNVAMSEGAVMTSQPRVAESLRRAAAEIRANASPKSVAAEDRASL